MPALASGQSCRHGDVNVDGVVDIADAGFLVQFLFVDASQAPDCDDADSTRGDGLGCTGFTNEICDAAFPPEQRGDFSLDFPDDDYRFSSPGAMPEIITQVMLANMARPPARTLAIRLSRPVKSVSTDGTIWALDTHIPPGLHSTTSYSSAPMKPGGPRQGLVNSPFSPIRPRADK